mgnify:CR=1 FL=1
MVIFILCSILIIFLISMVPLIELRGAIPYAIGFKTSAIAILHHLYPWKYASSAIYLFYLQERFSCGGSDKKYIGGFFNWCLKKGERGGKKLQEKAGRGLYVALFLFVGIPLPGTGAWTGTLAASLLDMDF